MRTKQRSTLDSDYITGVDRIDQQHANLINLVSDAHQILGTDSSPRQQEIVVKELLSYAIYHFKTEELMIQQFDYADAEPEEASTHISEHREFSRYVASLQEQIQSNHSIDSDELIQFLLDWIDQHIQQTDKKLARFLLKQEGF